MIPFSLSLSRSRFSPATAGFLTACLLALTAPLHATVTVRLQMGVASDSLGAAVADGTLWAIIADTNNDNSVAGVGLDSRLSSTATADTYFNANTSLSIGDTINGDRVIAMGGFNGEAGYGLKGMAVAEIAGISYDSSGSFSGVTEGRDFVFFWFPEAIYSGAGSHSIDFYTQNSIGAQVGGINSASTDIDAALGPMVFPSNGGSTPGYVGAGTSEVGGSTLASAFQAVPLTIPEPSALLLALPGLLLLGRRQRR